MTTTYKIEDETIVTLNTIGVEIERYYNADYWRIRLYIEDVFTPTVMALLIPNTTITVSIEDSVGTIEYTGTLSYWGTSQTYSYVEVLDCTIDFTAAP